VQRSPATTPWLSIAQFAVFALAVGGCWILAALLAASVLVSRTNQGALPMDMTSLGIQSAGLVFAGALFLPSTILALLKILGKPLPRSLTGRAGKFLPWILLLLWPLVLVAGNWIATRSALSWLILPPFYVLGVAIPIWGLVEIGRRGLPGGSSQRFWGLFNTGMLVGPTLVIAVELGALALGITGLVVWAASNPDITNEINRLFQQLIFSSPTTETLGRLFRPYLLRPGVLYLILASIAGVTPLIEEALKPFGLWLLARRGLSPAEGFVGGLLSGAGFALFESLGVTSNLPGENWASLTLARAGTDTVHIVASALVGWGLVSAWRDRRFLQFGIIYLISVTIHGFWNAISVALGVSPLIQMSPNSLPGFIQRASIAPWALGLLLAALLALLLGANARLRKSLAAGPERPAVPPGDERLGAQST